MLITEGELLNHHTTLKVGGPARYFTTVASYEMLSGALAFAKHHDLKHFLLGGGSNVLFSDAGYDGLIIKIAFTGRAYDVEDDQVMATFGAGEVFDEVVSETVTKGYWGLENLSHIPGSVGATPVQNVGAYGVEMQDVVEQLTAVDTSTGEKVSFTKEECEFAYRDSRFKRSPGRYVITEVTYRLSKSKQAKLTYKDLVFLQAVEELTPSRVRDEVIRIRSQKFPDWNLVGTAGSFFKNPIISREQFLLLKEQYPELPGYEMNEEQIKVSLGWILDHVLHLRGVRESAVGLFAQQALVLVNYDNATARDIIQFADNVASVVKEKTGINIEREVTAVE